MAAAETLIPSKVQAMEAEGHPACKVQALEVEGREKILASIRTKIQELHMANKDLSGLSEEGREARKAKAKADRSSLKLAFMHVGSGIRTPDYYSMTEAERAAEAEKLRQKKLEELRRLKAKGSADDWWVEEHRACITDFDPKQYGLYYNRMTLLISDPKFDIDHESPPFGPMRFTDKVYGKDMSYLDDAINILSVNIACSDVSFAFQVYGSVIARDGIDHKCIYLFRRYRDHRQFITSKDDPLILTGLKRGLVLTCDNYMETDLKIKDHLGQEREFSKGILPISDVQGRSLEESEVERDSIATRLSTVDVLYAAVKCALEGTVEIRVLRGRFCGTTTAHITSVQDKIMLYDECKADHRAKSTRCAHGIIQLMRSVICVPLRKVLIIDAKMSAGKYACLNFTTK